MNAKDAGLGEDRYTVNRPLIVTSNAAPTELSKIWDDRISDRLLSGTVFEATSASRRF